MNDRVCVVILSKASVSLLLLLSHPLDEGVCATGKDSSQERADPVDPVVALKAHNNGRAEAACRIETATGEEDTADLGNEEGEPNVHWLG